MSWYMTNKEKRKEKQLKRTFKKKYGIKGRSKRQRPKKQRRIWSHRTWRRKVLKRDDYKCQNCGLTEGLHVHHIKPLSEFPELSRIVSNGITLCRECHNNEHDGLLDYFSQQAHLKAIVDECRRNSV